MCMENLTNRQKELIEKAKNQGYLTEKDFFAMFTSPIARKNNIKRLEALGYIEYDSEKQNYKYTGDSK